MADQNDDEYEVQKILRKRIRNEKVTIFIKLSLFDPVCTFNIFFFELF